MPITHDLYLSATLARLWNTGPNAGDRPRSAWDRPRHDPSSHRATPPTPAGIADRGQPAGVRGVATAKTAVEKL